MDFLGLFSERGIEPTWSVRQELEGEGPNTKSQRRLTAMAGSPGSLDSGGIPQSSTPGIGGGRSSARIRDSSSCGSSGVAF